MATDSYDVVIVGGGTAGLVLAARLSENADLQVAVVEAGEDQATNPQVLTPGMWPLLANTPLDWAFSTAPQKLGKKDLVLPQGHALGGSSTINSFLFTPTSKSNVEAWGNLGNEGWNWPAFEEALSKSYTLTEADGTVKGNGPLQLNRSDPNAKWTKVWTDSLGSLGFPINDAFTGEVCGSLIMPESIDPAKKQRSSSANTYLAGARERANLTILTGAAVSKIILNKSGDAAVAEGVQITKDGETKMIKASKEVILASGPVNSPRLLELSGIGGAELLKELGINVVVDNPHVGENLQNHALTGINFAVRDDVETLDPLLRRDPAATGAAMQAYGKGTGPLSTSNTVASARLPLPKPLGAELEALLQTGSAESTRTTADFSKAHDEYVRSVLEGSKEPSVIYIAAPAFAPIESADPTIRPDGNHFTVVLLLAHPLSRGSIHITSASADNASGKKGVVIDPKYLSHPLDVEVLARHLCYTEQTIGKAEPFASQLKPRDDRFSDLEAAKEYVKKTGKGAHHYTGTCSMMPQALGGVVDEKLRVYGTKNLRVCDSSIIPLTPNANPQATVYGVAELGATLIKSTM